MNSGAKWLSLAFLLGGVLAGANAALATEIEDSAGRVVSVTEQVDRIFAAGPPAAILLFTLAPDKLLGWTRAPSPEEAAFLPEAYRDLPAHGRLTGQGNSINLEKLLTLEPDLVVDVGSVSDTYADLADRVSQQTGVPSVLFGGRLDELPGTYRRLGDILDLEEHAERLAGYIETTLDEIQGRIAEVPPEDRPRMYYARGPDGLDTALSGSINVEAMDFVGARNVAGEALGGGGLSSVSLEQVIAWDPEVIFTVNPDFAAQVEGNPRWQTVSAVEAGRVHLAPQLPFPWIDFPPSVNRVLGVRWLASILYPDLFPEPMEEISREFYELFYMRDLREGEVQQLLGP